MPTHSIQLDGTFEHWRLCARGLIDRRIAPESVFFEDPRDGQRSLLGRHPTDPEALCQTEGAPFVVPRGFLTQAKLAAFHRSKTRWILLYTLLWRMVVLGERGLCDLATDPEVSTLRDMVKAVRRDAHKMKAFVRFKEVPGRVDTFMAYYEPDHHVLDHVAPFFADRFGPMTWRIVTPDRTAIWEDQRLRFESGELMYHVEEDVQDALWRTYWSSIYNPARMNLKAMRAEMPQKFWKHLPEVRILPHLIQDTPARVQAMIENAPGSAKPLIPKQASTLEELAQAASGCRACPLGGCPGTRTVFGSGPQRARIVIIGEQPGDVEDQLGTPFVGPAGRVLDRALSCAGVRREEVYLTNAVKHFHHRLEQGRRIHQTPEAHHVHGCRPWLEAELGLIKPDLVICLGRTSAQALLGRRVVLKHERGKLQPSVWAKQGVIATYHPAAALRAWDRKRQLAIEGALAADLGFAAGLVQGRLEGEAAGE